MPKTRWNERGCPKFLRRRKRLIKDSRKYPRKTNVAGDRSKLNQRLCAFKKRKTAHLSWAYKQLTKQKAKKWPNDKLVSNWSNLRGSKRKNWGLRWRGSAKWTKKRWRGRCSLSRPKRKLKGSSRCKLIMLNLSLKDSKKWDLKRRKNWTLSKGAMRRKKDRGRPNCKYKRRLSVKDSWSLQKLTRLSRWWGRKSSQVTNWLKPRGNWGPADCTKRERALKFIISPTRFQGTWATSRYPRMRTPLIRRWTRSQNTNLPLKLRLISLTYRSSKYAMTSSKRLQSSSDPVEETYSTQKSWKWSRKTTSLSRWFMLELNNIWSALTKSVWITKFVRLDMKRTTRLRSRSQVVAQNHCRTTLTRIIGNPRRPLWNLW